MSISFNAIPSNLRVPMMYIEFDNTGAKQGTNKKPYKALILGQKLAAGEAAADAIVRVQSADQAGKLFGFGSMLHRMFVAWFASNKTTEVFALPLADADDSVAAAGSITFAGTATASGTIAALIGGVYVRAGVVSGDTASNVATAVAAAINAVSGIPVSAAVDGTNTAKVNITAKNKGTVGNGFKIYPNFYEGEAYPAGISATIEQLASGATDPLIAAKLTALADTQYEIIVNTYLDTTNFNALDTLLEERWGPLYQMAGIAFSAKDDTLANLSTFGSGKNTQFYSCIGTYNSPSPVIEWAASYAANVAFYGNIDPARPFQTLELKGLIAPKADERFSLMDRNTLLYDGIATHNVDSGGSVRIERSVTMYQKNEFGADDDSYLDVNTVLTLMFLRYDFRTFMLSKYPRHKLADDGRRYGAGQAIITPNTAKAECIARFRMWEEEGLVEDVDAFKDGLIVERDASDPNRLNFQLTPDVVNQFMIGAVKIKYLL